MNLIFTSSVIVCFAYSFCPPLLMHAWSFFIQQVLWQARHGSGKLCATVMDRTYLIRSSHDFLDDLDAAIYN